MINRQTVQLFAHGITMVQTIDDQIYPYLIG